MNLMAHRPQNPMPRLTLRCDALNESYTLSEDGKDWTKDFDSLESAMEYAGGLVTEQEELIVINEKGKVITHSRVNPNIQRDLA
jgi:hypothetical protein